MNLLPPPEVSIFRGMEVWAEYTKWPQVPHYHDNPFIEALPPTWTQDIAFKQFAYYPPPVLDAQRNLPNEIRYHNVFNTSLFYDPMETTFRFYSNLDRSIRMGYVARNPLIRDFFRRLDKNLKPIDETQRLLTAFANTSYSFGGLGFSGMGKSLTAQRVLSFIPQVIHHTVFPHSKQDNIDFNFAQLSWLKTDCPFNGSVSAIIENSIKEVDRVLGTDYYNLYIANRKLKVETLIRIWGRISSLHALGVYVIDEIQNSSAAKSGGYQQMLNFFVEVENLGIPVIVIGTDRAKVFLQKATHTIRRVVPDVDWPRMSYDPSWEHFVRSLWRYQYIQKPVEFTNELSATLYDVSQGITDYVVKVFLLSQVRAIKNKSETLSEPLIRDVAARSLAMAAPFLEALRSGDTGALVGFDDVRIPTISELINQEIENDKIDLSPSGSPQDLAGQSQTTDNQTELPTQATGLPQKAKENPDAIDVNSNQAQSKIKQSKKAQEESSIERPKKSKPAVAKTATSSKAHKTKSVKSGIMAITDNLPNQESSAYEKLKAAGIIQSPDQIIKPGK